MKRIIATATCVSLFWACGGAPAGMVAGVQVRGLHEDEVASLDFYVYGPERIDDVQLLCGSFYIEGLTPGDERLDELLSLNVPADASTNRVLLNEVPSGEGLVLWVVATDSAGAPVGTGCAENITVSERATTEVTVVVYDRVP